MEDCVLQLDMLTGQGGQQWVSLLRGRSAPTREWLCWHCVWILWTMLSQTRRGWWPNQSPCYWNRAGDYSSQPFDFSRGFFFFSVCVCVLFFTAPLDFSFFFFGKSCRLKGTSRPFLGSTPQPIHARIGTIQIIYDSKVILLAQVKLEVFQAQLWDVERRHINQECTGRNEEEACHMHCQ